MMDLHTTRVSSALQFHIFPLEEAVCNFWSSSLLCQLYIWSVMLPFYLGCQFSFWHIKDSYEIVKLQWIFTKHIYIYFWRIFSFTSLHTIFATLISSFLLRLFSCCWALTHSFDSYASSIMTNVMYGIIVLLQCSISMVV